MIYTRILIAAAFLVTPLATARSQTITASADSALTACARLAAAGDEASALAQAATAENEFDRMIAGSPGAVAALTGKARVISQCRVPFAPLLRKAALIDDSNQLLQRALAIDSTNFAARFTLAMHHYSVPEFLGRTDDAIREFEKLMAQHGERPIAPLATAYLRLGELYLRKGRKPDAVRVWRRGLELHPARASDFEAKLTEAGASAPLDDASTATAKTAPVYDMAPIVVEAGRFSVDDTRGSASLKRLDIVTMPGGTADVLQVFQTMPGVTRATEGSDLYVRGGDPAEAPVFVDGARMTYAGAFETLHGGIFGVLDPNAIRKADFSSGGFSVRYGNALSGVLDITTEGRPQRTSWRAGANLVSLGSSVRHPLGSNAGVWATGKATQTSALLWTQGKTDLYPGKPWSVSGMTGFAYEPNANVEIKATALTETDAATRNVDVLGYSGALRSAGATHMAVLSARVLNREATSSLRASLSAARRSTEFALGVLDRERHDDMFTARVDADVARTATVRIRTGVEAAALRAGEEGTVPLAAELAPGSAFRTLQDAQAEGTHAGGYVETEVSATSKFAFIAGTRVDRLPAADAWTVDPRIALAYRAQGWTLRTGGGVFHQSAWRSGYRTPNPGAPAEVATRARHVVVGVERETPVLLRVEAFVKSYDDYMSVAGTTAEGFTARGPAIDRGSTRGIDALVRWKPSGSISGWASYSYLNGKVRLREGDWIPSASDVRHTFTGVGKLVFGNNWEIGTTARLASGRPFTPIIGAQLNEDGSRAAMYGATHSARLPDYVRFDTRLTRLVPTRTGMFVFYLEGLNLLDRANVMAYTYDARYTRRVPVESFFASRTLVFGAEAMF